MKPYESTRMEFTLVKIRTVVLSCVEIQYAKCVYILLAKTNGAKINKPEKLVRSIEQSLASATLHCAHAVFLALPA